MFRRVSLVIAAGTLMTGAVAAYASPFPASVNETGPYQPEVYLAPRPLAGESRTAITAESATFPVSVSEVGSSYPQQSLTSLDTAPQTESRACGFCREKQPWISMH